MTRRLRSIAVVLLAVFALGAVAVSTASGETAPYFTVGGTRLVAGKTHNIAARVFNTNSFTLTSAAFGLKVTCTALKIGDGVLLGSNAGEPGKDHEIGELSGCTLVEGNGEANGCTLEGTTITTNQIVSEQVENVVSSKNGGQLLEVFRPANGATGFLTVKFAGGEKCTIEEAVAAGSAVAEVLKDETAEGKVELGQTPTQATSVLLKFPSTTITKVWLISNGVGKSAKVGLTFFGAEPVISGTELVLLANTKFQPEAALWSPLP